MKRKWEEMEIEEEEEEEDPMLSINWAEAPWPPVWKERIEDSPQYACGLISGFVERWALEDLPDEKPDSDFNVPARPKNYCGPPDVNYHRTIKAFLEQVRKSRGYDLDVNAPWFINTPFSVMTPFLEQGTYQATLWKRLSPIVNFALAQINTNAKLHGKCYELLKVVKLVDAKPHRTRLITFTVKEIAPGNNVDVVETIQAMVYTGCCRDEYRLIEWRFKPDEE